MLKIDDIYKEIQSTDNFPPPLIDSNTDGTSQYLGFAFRGTALSDNKWKIIKITEVVGGLGTITTLESPNGKWTYDSVWDNRASLTYRR